MHRLALLISFVMGISCTVYKAPGRKFLEDNANKYSNGRLSVTYRCANKSERPDPAMKALGEVEAGIWAWAETPGADGGWFLLGNSHSCGFEVTGSSENPVDILVQLYRHSLDEGP